MVIYNGKNSDLQMFMVHLEQRQKLLFTEQLCSGKYFAECQSGYRNEHAFGQIVG